MSEMEKKICLGCMQEINADDVMCPHCGFDPNNYRVNPRCLRLGTKACREIYYWKSNW